MTGYPTSIGTSDETTIHLLGQDLAAELMGQVGFGELAFWLVAMRRPTAGELRVFESVLVALADHGFTPSAIAARLTLTGAPESVQGALAAGLLGGGSRYLGVTEDAGGVPRRGPRRPPARRRGAADVRRRLGRPGPRPRSRPGRRPAAGCPGSATRCTRTATRVRRCSSGSPTRRACADRTCGCSRPSAGCTPSCSAAPCRSTAPASAGQPCATSASPRTSCAASRCWPARPGWSGTSPRRCAARSARRSTSRSTAQRSTSRRRAD